MKAPLGPITPQTREFLAQQQFLAQQLSAHLGARCIPATSSAFLNSCRRSPIAVAVGQEVTHRPCLPQSVLRFSTIRRPAIRRRSSER